MKRYYYPGLSSQECCVVANDYNHAISIFAKTLGWKASEVRDDLQGERLFEGGEDNRPIGYYGR